MYMRIGKPEKYTHPTSLIAGLTSNTAEDCKAGRQEPALRRSIFMRVSAESISKTLKYFTRWDKCFCIVVVGFPPEELIFSKIFAVF